MKKFLFMLCLIALITGCNNATKQNELNEQKQYEATRAAENAPITVSELPFNFQFGMSRSQVDSLLTVLVNDSIIRKPIDMYYYDYKLKSGRTVETYMNFGFHNDSLYSVVFDISSFNQIVNDELIHEIDDDISSRLDSTYTRISHYDESGMIFTKWFKGNQYIFLRKAVFNDISFVNVEWGNVVKTDNGYMVRHKYRAKNSFGGYMVDNNVFYLDFQGNVVSVSAY